MTKLVLKWSKWLSFSLISAVLLLALSFVLLLFTKPGLGVVLWGAERLVPQLTVGSYQGSLFPRFTLQQVRYVDPQIHVETSIEALTLAVKPACITEPSVCVDDISLQGVKFALTELPPSQPNDQEAASTNNAITSPLPIRVSRVLLEDIELNILGHQIQWQTFSTGLNFQGNRLLVSPTRLDNAVVKLATVGKETAQENREKQPRQAIALPDIELPLVIELQRLDIDNFKLDQASPLVVNHLGLTALASGSDVEISTFELDMPEVKGNLQGKATLKQDYPIELSLNATLGISPVNGQQIDLAASGSVANLSLRAKLRNLLRADLNAQLEPLDPDFPFDIAIEKLKAQWPLSGEADYKADIARLSGKGSLTGYQLSLKGEVKGKPIPDASVELKGKGDLSQLKLTKLAIDGLGGSVAGRAMVNWQAPLNWSADLDFTDLQPGLQWPEAEGNISGKLSTKGSLTKQGGWQVSIPKLDLDGILRQYPLNVLGSLELSDRKGTGELSLQTPKLVLSHGPNLIEASGGLEQKWDMDVRIEFPELAKSVAELTGSAIGSLQISGELAEPQVVVDLAVKQLDWRGEAQVDSLLLKGDVVPLPDPHGMVQLEVKGINYQGNVIDDVILNAAGTEQAHQVTLDVNSSLIATSLALSGDVVTQPDLKWMGQLERMNLRSKQGEWRLSTPTRLSVDMATQLASVAAHCWQQDSASICLDKDITVGSRGEVQLSIQQFNFEQLAMFLPKKTELAGLLNGVVWAKWFPDRAPELKVTLTLPKGAITQQLEKPLVLAWESVKVNTSLANGQLQADWLFDITDNGDISGELTIPDIQAQDKQLDGRLALGAFSLDFLNSLVDEYSQLQAILETDLKFSGPLLHPMVNGRFTVENILLRGDISPIEIDSGGVALNLTGYDATLSAALQTPDGQLQVSGDANWQELNNWRSQVRVFAEELKVMMPPMVKVKVIPDMTISASPKQARIDGKISLPWGRVVIDELPPTAIGISKDQVIVDAQGKPVKEDNLVPFDIETDIDIHIGDKFKLSAFGLEGNLVGKLNVTQKNKGPFIVGEVNIEDGSYSSFGQDLLITKGKILMNGPPDQPYVQISAIRNPDNTQDDVTAGVRVTGPADEPQLTIFSTPSMPQANALSYLLRGQDIDAESSGNAMTTTLIGLSLAKSGKVVGELGEAFGVQDLQLDTTGSGDDSQVTVSGYVLPGLQVKYGVGIFDSVGEFTVRYRLMKDLYLEAVSGLDSAVDLLYQFEFD